jgi:hypothetical protein
MTSKGIKIIVCECLTGGKIPVRPKRVGGGLKFGIAKGLCQALQGNGSYLRANAISGYYGKVYLVQKASQGWFLQPYPLRGAFAHDLVGNDF